MKCDAIALFGCAEKFQGRFACEEKVILGCHCAFSLRGVGAKFLLYFLSCADI